MGTGKSLSVRCIELATIGLSEATRPFSESSPRALGVHVLTDIPYKKNLTLDLYLPPEPSRTFAPVLVYLHGGGFEILSKKTHWLFGARFAAAGFLTFLIDYRAAPKNKFPCALEDTLDAIQFASENAPHYGGDSQQLVLAGESAGANLVVAATVAATIARPEPFAARFFEHQIVPTAILPGCGIYETHNTSRYDRIEKRSLIRARIKDVERAYLPQNREGTDLASPLRVLEKQPILKRPWPPSFFFCGSKDPVLNDSQRMVKALRPLADNVGGKFYQGGFHAFHAFTWDKMAERCWSDQISFLEQTLAPR